MVNATETEDENGRNKKNRLRGGSTKTVKVLFNRRSKNNKRKIREWNEIVKGKAKVVCS